MNGNSLARQFTGTSLAKDVTKSAAKSAAKRAAKSAAKSAAKNAVKNSTAEQLFGTYHNCSHFGLGALLTTRFLDPFLRISGSVAGSLSAQCNPLSNVMQLNVLKDCVHPILGATLIKTGAYHDMR